MTKLTYTKQKAFEKIVKSLHKQGVISLTGAGANRMCAYRSPNGLRCGIGHLISDRIYDKEMEGRSANWIFGAYPSFRELFNVGNADDEMYFEIKTFIQSCQVSLHDKYMSYANTNGTVLVFRDWLLREANTFAYHYNLDNAFMKEMKNV